MWSVGKTKGQERVTKKDEKAEDKHEKCRKRERTYGMYSGGGVRYLEKLRVWRSKPLKMLKTILFA